MITNPVGLDEKIQELQTAFQNLLFPGSVTFTAYGRVFRNEREGGVVPEAYLGDEEYQDVMMDDNTDGVVFFDVNPDITINLFDASADVDIVFMIDLASLYTHTHRAVEEAHIDALRVINDSPFKPSGLVSGVDAISDYVYSDNARYNMQPYYCFKIICSVKYKICD